jgi:hypothetical protein
MSADLPGSYANMDYIFASVVQKMMLLFILVSYDIACQWFVNLFKRAEHWPDDLSLPSSTTFIPAIPKLHEPMHKSSNHEVYSLNYILGAGLSDLECPERVWAGHNAIGNSTKSQGPGSRHDILDDHFSFWNWQKYSTMGRTLMRKYRNALAERNIQSEAHRGLTVSLSPDLVVKWEAACIAWERDSFPRTKTNPYQSNSTSG